MIYIQPCFRQGPDNLDTMPYDYELASTQDVSLHPPVVEDKLPEVKGGDSIMHMKTLELGKEDGDSDPAENPKVGREKKTQSYMMD